MNWQQQPQSTQPNSSAPPQPSSPYPHPFPPYSTPPPYAGPFYTVPPPSLPPQHAGPTYSVPVPPHHPHSSMPMPVPVFSLPPRFHYPPTTMFQPPFPFPPPSTHIPPPSSHISPPSPHIPPPSVLLNPNIPIPRQQYSNVMWCCYVEQNQPEHTMDVGNNPKTQPCSSSEIHLTSTNLSAPKTPGPSNPRNQSPDHHRHSPEPGPSRPRSPASAPPSKRGRAMSSHSDSDLSASEQHAAMLDFQDDFSDTDSDFEPQRKPLALKWIEASKKKAPQKPSKVKTAARSKQTRTRGKSQKPDNVEDATLCLPTEDINRNEVIVISDDDDTTSHVRSQNEEGSESSTYRPKCSICLEEEPFITGINYPCMHHGCWTCMRAWYNHTKSFPGGATCHMCRQTVNNVY